MMMEDLIKILICVVIVMVVTLLQTVINLKKNYRARQVLLPIVALSYAITAVITAYNHLGDITSWIQSLHEAAELAEEAAKYSPEAAQAAQAAKQLAEFADASEVAILNAMVMIPFLGVKGMALPLVKKFCNHKRLLEHTAIAFYHFDEDYEEWFLRKKWVNFRNFFFAIVCGASAAAGIYLGLAWMLGKEHLLWNLAFPCAALLVLNECYNFINGQTKEEFEHSVYGDEADSRKISNFYKVREVLEQMLPEPLLSSHTGYEYAGKQTPADLIDEWKESEDRIDVVTAEYFEVDNRYMSADIDCVQATGQLMHRHNVVLFNPFYRDLSMYVTLPLVNALLSGKKCTVITGRRSNRLDVRDWLTEVLSKYSHMKSLWRVELLSDKEPECEVGILTFSQLYDKRLIATNRDFLRETDFVLLIEPSLIVNTGQVALSIIAQEMHCNDEAPVYCIIDRNTDGLVDTLSHLLHANITNVVAPPVPRCIYTGMSWDADGDFIRQQLFDKQTRYLGNGMELAAIAVKNQIPKVSWYSETKAPIKDIKWIAGQNHPTICRYMNLPAQQKTLYEKIEFISNLWSTASEPEKFLIVEDEFCNMFATMRAYLSRGMTQSFVNVMSENYMLRDYMRCNRQMFMSNNNAIPSIVPDYAKTERNTLIKLLLLMTLRPVTDAEIIDEFHLVGIETEDALDILTEMLEKHTFANNSIFTIQTVRKETENFTTMSTTQYTIDSEVFDTYFADSLKNAYFILEEERHEEGYIDAKLFNHVAQIILPGQFVTYDGKYYMAKHVSPQSGVVLRRASDLYDGRKYYRQIREYTLDENAAQEIVSLKTVMDIEIAYFRTDFSVHTSGYLEMRDNHDLRLARKIDFTGDPAVDNYTRRYHNKSVLRIKLPDTNDKIRFTICLLLSEAFKSIFPDGWPYLAVVAKRPEDIDGMLNYMVYPVKGQVEEDYIYIIEDSDIDLGLMEAVERNLMKLMEIITDFLEWHFEKMREPARKDPVPPSVNATERRAAKKKQGLVSKMLQKINKLVGVKKVEEVKISDDIDSVPTPKPEEQSETGTTTEKPVEPTGETPIAEMPTKDDTEYTLDVEPEKKEISEASEDDEEETSDISIKVGDVVISMPSDDVKIFNNVDEDKEAEAEEFLPSEGEDPELAPIDGTDIFDDESLQDGDLELERCFEEAGLFEIEPTRYQEECFLKFGYKDIDARLKLDEVHKYLRVRSWSNNSLTKARRRDILVKKDLDLEAVNHCDFCGLPLSGVSYEMLNDGRIRCNDCSSSGITSEKDFRKMFFQILDMMEAIYGVKYRVPIKVAMADARKVAKGYGSIYRPSTGVAPRVIGFAQRKWGKYSILMENGAPRLVAIDTMVHEMTHIWQYLNWGDNQITDTYKMNCPDCTMIARDIVYEGMAMWAAVQYLYQIGETYFAAQQEVMAAQRQDVYGIGFRLFCEQYPIIKDSALIKYSPFNSYPPLEPEKVYEAVKMQCVKDECKC